jgi:predicted phage-related endonuclease
MKYLDIQQGSAEWLAARGSYRCASEATVVMSASKKLSRSELVRMKAIGNEHLFSQYVREKVLEKGHEIEAMARPLVEDELCVELYPVTAVDDDGVYLASFDGMTMDESACWECKSANVALLASARRGEIPEEYTWQLEHQAMVSGVSVVYFTVSDGTPENTITLHYTPDEAKQRLLRAAWDQFDRDVAAYQHIEVLPAPAASERPQLPAVSIRVDGKIALVSNLDIFGAKLRSFLDNLNKSPSTDQDFADAEQAIKTLEAAESALTAAESSALAQTAGVDEMVRTVASYRELARSNRLVIEKLVKARKETIRAEIVQAGKAALENHLVLLRERIGGDYLPVIPADFAGAVKGKRTIASLRDAVDEELARVKIAANEAADRAQINLRKIRELAQGEMHQFPDLRALVLKPTDDCLAVVRLRLAENAAAAQKKAEAERARIEAEIRAEVERERLQEQWRQSQAAKASAEATAMAAAPPSTASVAQEPATAQPDPSPVMVWGDAQPDAAVAPRPTGEQQVAAVEAIGRALGSVPEPRKFLAGILGSEAHIELVTIGNGVYRLTVAKGPW